MFTCTFAGLIAELGSRGGSHGDNFLLVELPLVVDLLAQCPSLPGRQLTQVFLAFTQAQPLQWPDLLHLQHTIAHIKNPAALQNGGEYTVNACPPG